jgi:hypothetical protein
LMVLVVDRVVQQRQVNSGLRRRRLNFHVSISLSQQVRAARAVVTLCSWRHCSIRW